MSLAGMVDSAASISGGDRREEIRGWELVGGWVTEV